MKRLNSRQRKARKERNNLIASIVGALFIVPPVLMVAFFIGQDMATRAIGAK